VDGVVDDEASGSAKTVIASSNVTPCLRSFAPLDRIHVNRIAE